MKVKGITIFILFNVLLQLKLGKTSDGNDKIDLSATANGELQRSEIVTSPNDKRLYRGLQLSNNLKVVLISDPSTEKSGVSLVVGVGALNDFVDVPGLANLVGYLLMKGSRSYPASYGFNKYVKRHKGNIKLPSTSAHDQRFTFDINPARLSGALNRFAQFFIEPLFLFTSAEILEEPIDLVQQEFERQANSDDVRIALVEQSTICKKNHLYCHLFNGNKETLYQHAEALFDLEKWTPDPKMVSLYEKVEKFYSIWYSSNIMTLAVLGRENLDQLEELVVSLFEKIENKNRQKLMFSLKNHPWGPEQLKHNLYIVPLSGKQSINLKFPVPDFTDKYRTAPDLYISNLITHPRSGGLYSILKRKGLITDLHVKYECSVGIAWFIIHSELTNDGAKCIDRVIKLIFKFIRLIREQGVQEQTFKEGKKFLEAVFFSHQQLDESAQPYSYVEELAVSLQKYPMKDILWHKYSLQQWDPLVIKELLSHLKPDNMNVTIIGKSFELLTDQREKYYNTKYGISRISGKLIEEWIKDDDLPEVQLPTLNKFMPENLILYPVHKNAPKIPRLIHQSSISEIWFKQDNIFRIPKLAITFELFSSQAYLGPDKYVLLHIFHTLLNIALRKKLETALAADLHWEIHLPGTELQFTLYGYNEKLLLLLEDILSDMTNFQSHLDEKPFEYLLIEHLNHLKNSITREHFFQINWYMQYLLTARGWDTETTIRAGTTLLFSDMKKFVSKVFRRIFIRGLIHGNCTEEEALRIVKVIEKSFPSSSGLLLQEILPSRAVEVSEQGHFILQAFNDKSADIFGFNAHFQLNFRPHVVNHYVISLLFYHTVQEVCKGVLKEKDKKKPEIIKCSFLETHNLRGLALVAISNRDPRSIESRVRKFLQTVPRILENLRESELESVKENLRKKELKKPSTLHELTDQYWIEIVQRCYIFDRNDLEHEYLNSVKKDDLLMYQKVMVKYITALRSYQQRRLVVNIFPRSMEKNEKMLAKFIPTGATKIADMEEFKRDSSLLPHY